MALAKEVMGGGLSAGAARAIGGGYASVAATGSTVANAANLSAGACVVTAADGTKGVVLTGGVGDSQWVFNNSGSTLKVYPSSLTAICVTGSGLGTADAVYSLLTYKCGLFKRVSATQWFLVVT